MADIPTSTPISRRTTLSWIARAGVANLAIASGLTSCGFADDPKSVIEPVSAEGYGRDPDLFEPAVPWPLTMTQDQKLTTRKLVDIFLPADNVSPAGSEINVDSFIDEWVSAPYPIQASDRQIVLAGITRLIAGRFLSSNGKESENFVRDMSNPRTNHHRDDYRFFSRLRYIAMTGYYCSEVGIKDLGYVGNEPLERFEGPTPEILKKLGL